jgi:hypothetical protein
VDVFISWSGEGSQSHQLAIAPKEWLPRVIRSVRPWISDADLSKGLPWFEQLYNAVNSATECLVCVTPLSLSSTWMAFEAGVVASRIGVTRVTPVLLYDETALTGHLAVFQAVKLNRVDVLRMLTGLNQRLGEHGLQQQILTEEFNDRWERFSARIDEIRESQPAPKPPEDTEIIREILTGVRSLHRILDGVRYVRAGSPRPQSWLVGARVRHATFGDGSIVLVENPDSLGSGRVSVMFDSEGQKEVMGSYLDLL